MAYRRRRRSYGSRGRRLVSRRPRRRGYRASYRPRRRVPMRRRVGFRM